MHFIKTHKTKKNLVEKALVNHNHQREISTRATFDFNGLKNFLATKYNFTNITPIISYVYNVFLTASVPLGAITQTVFIKTGRHPGLYKNEFVMGRQLYDIDPKHFLKPLYYNDYEKYNFFANEYVMGKTLETLVESGNLSLKRRAKIIDDIYHIFLAMKSSDVVHRDIRPANIMILKDGRTVLIDFQLAVSKSNYKELDYCQHRPSILRNLGDSKFRYKQFIWDDSYSLMRVVEYIGRHDKYGQLYDTVHRRIKSYIGRDIIKSSVRESEIQRTIRHIRPTRKPHIK